MVKNGFEQGGLDIKKTVRQLQMRIHPDTGGPLPEEPGGHLLGLHVLNEITSSQFEREWLNLEPGTPVLLHGNSNVPHAVVDLPETPEQFVKLYDHFLKTGGVIDVPLPHWARRRPEGGRQFEREEAEFDALVLRYRNSLLNISSVDELMIKTQALEMLSPEDIRDLHIRELLDEQALRLFREEFAKAGLLEFEALKAKLDAFPFSEASLRNEIYDESSEAWFTKKMRRARSRQGLEALQKQLDDFRFQNEERGDSIKKKVGNLIQRKLNIYFPAHP